MERIVTIERHIIETQREFPLATGVLSSLLYDIALSAKIIARETTRAGLVNILGSAGRTNIQGEDQQKLDVFAHLTIFRMNDHTGRLCLMASEEHEDIIPIPDRYPRGKYVLVFDPLDGSSNADVNASIATIFAIHRKIIPGDHGQLEDVLQPGRDIVAAGYIVYGPSTMLVYSTGHGVHGFTLDPSVGEFLLSHPDIRLPDSAKYYSCNQGHEKFWPPGVRRFVEWLQAKDDPARKPIDARYSGALVADVHRILLQGGIFFYPGDLRDPAKPYGKLRLIYECAPLAFLVAQAGGYASDGLGSVLDLAPYALHQRIPFFIGDRALVEQAERFILDYDGEWTQAYRALRHGTQ